MFPLRLPAALCSRLALMTIRSYQAVSYSLTFPVVLSDPALAAEQGSAAAAAVGTVRNTAGHVVRHMFDLYFACFRQLQLC